MLELKKYIHYDTDLESAVLGACLLEATAFSRIYQLMKPEIFYKTGHSLVYETFQEMWKIGEPIDILTVTGRIVRNGNEVIDGDDPAFFVTRLTNAVVSSAHLEKHCMILRQLYTERELLRIKYAPEKEEGDVIDRAKELQHKISDLLNINLSNDWMDTTQMIVKLFQHQADMADGSKKLVTTGFKSLDSKNGGFGEGQMIVIGARPSVGKSALMGKIAMSQAKQGFKVGIMSLEMNNTEIAARLASIDSDIPFWKIYRNIAQDEQLHRIFYQRVSKSMVQLPIYVSDKTRVNIHDIRAKAMKLKATEGCDVIMIDYLQLVDAETTNRNYNREQQVSQLSRGIKLMAMEMKIPVIVLCQLNRQQTARSYADRFPRLSDLRESGAIEQDADIVMFIHRDYMSGYEVDDQGNSTERKADLVVSKWRNGAPCRLELGFDPEQMNFYEGLAAPSGYVPVNYSEPGKALDEDPF